MKCYIRKHFQKKHHYFFGFRLDISTFQTNFYSIQNFNWWVVFSLITPWTCTCLSPLVLFREQVKAYVTQSNITYYNTTILDTLILSDHAFNLFVSGELLIIIISLKIKYFENTLQGEAFRILQVLSWWFYKHHCHTLFIHHTNYLSLESVKLSHAYTIRATQYYLFLET